MSFKSELTIHYHCDSLRHKVDIARETEIENLHKASKALIVEIDTYEQECLSSWREVKQSNEDVVEDESKRMAAFIAEQQAFLQRVHEREDELATLRVEEANKLAQELSDRKMEFKAALFNDKLASFIAFPSMDDTSLGELRFTTIQIPFKTLDIVINELTPIDIRVDYDFVLPLEHCKRIVAFKWYFNNDQFENEFYTQITCVDPLGRLLGTYNLHKQCVRREDVAQCGPNQFVVFYACQSPKLMVYNSSFHCLRIVSCKNFSNICCNSKFVFGLWNTYDSFDSDGDDGDNHERYEQEREEQPSSQRIQVRHLDTLSKAFSLRAPDEYTIEQILADEHHVVAMSQLNSERDSPHWYMSIFNLATCNESDETAARTKFFQAEKTIDLAIESVSLANVFLFDGWLVFPLKDEDELVWFDKNGARSETTTEWDSDYLKEIFSFGSGLLFAQNDSKILLKL